MQLYQGDCLEVMKTLPDKSVDCIVTSPPYDNLRTYNGNLIWNFNIFCKVAYELYRILKDGGVIVWIVADATINGSETGTSFRQALYFKEIGFNIHDTMIWSKPTFTDTGSLKTRYGNTFEYMFIFSKGKIKTFNPIKDRKNKRFGDKKHGTIRQKNGTTKKQSSLGKIIQEYGQRFNVWNLPTCQSNIERKHPAQFPVNLVKDHIISWTNENDVILDPFMGSGTTGVACKHLNRNFIGIEIDQNYFEIAKNRIENEPTQLTLAEQKD